MKFLLIVILIVSCELCFGQKASYAGIFPEAEVIKSMGKFYTAIKIESQHSLLNINQTEVDRFGYFHDRTDLQGFIGIKMKNDSKWTIGYQYRLQPNVDNHRSIQQYSWLSRNEYLKVSHRIRADQTFELNQFVQWRIRYRLSVQIPLSNGKQQYLLISDEPIYSLKEGTSVLENRFVLALGILLTDQCKFQIGPDYRLDGDLVTKPRTRLWLKIGWFYRL
ncbi:MAG: hypothetical protein ACJA08_003162 [Cyclobacteriaceae bacterium]